MSRFRRLGDDSKGRSMDRPASPIQQALNAPHRSSSPSSTLSRSSSRSSLFGSPGRGVGAFRTAEKISNFDKFLKSEVLSLECRATKTTLRDIEGELVASNQGGCDRWRYRDESLVNVATGRAVTMTSSQGGRRILLVPKDKSFSTQKFIVMTSGVIIAKNDAFVITVDDQTRASRGDQFRSNVTLEPKKDKETRYQTFYVQVHIAPEKPLPDSDCVPSRMRFYPDDVHEDFERHADVPFTSPPRTPTMERVAVVSSASSSSLNSSASFQSEVSSIMHRRQRRLNFMALLAERGFEILSRKTKFVLAVDADGKIGFLDRDEAPHERHLWILDRSLLRLVTTSRRNCFLSIVETSGGSLELLVSASSTNERMRQWIVEDDGSITSAAFPELALTSLSRRSKNEKSQGIDLIPKETAREGRRKQDATFDFAITLEEGEAIPNSALYPSRVKFFPPAISMPASPPATTVTREEADVVRDGDENDLEGAAAASNDGGSSVGCASSAFYEFLDTERVELLGITAFASLPVRSTRTPTRTECGSDVDDASSLCSSMASSSRAEPKDRVQALKLFLAKLEEEEFEIRSRKSKFALNCADEGKVVFVATTGDDPAHRWRYKRDKLRNTATNQVLALQSLESSSAYQLVAKEWDRVSPFQQWRVDDGGRIVSLHCPNLVMTSIPRTSKSDKEHLVGVCNKELKDRRKMQDQTFDFQITVPMDEPLPRADSYPSRMKFVRKSNVADHVFKNAKDDFDPLDVEMTAAPSGIAEEASVCASESTTSLDSNVSSASFKNRPELRRHFREMIEKSEMDILSRKSKYRLRNENGVIKFCDFENGLTTSWFYRNGRIHCGDTNLVVACDVENPSTFELALKSKDATDWLQLWNVEGDGRISLQSRPDLLWTSQPRKSKYSGCHGLTVGKKEYKDAKVMQNQTFTFLVKVGINQRMPQADLYPSRMKFIRKSASEKTVNIVSVADRRETESLQLFNATYDYNADVDECGEERRLEGKHPAPEAQVMTLTEAREVEAAAPIEDGQKGTARGNVLLTSATPMSPVGMKPLILSQMSSPLVTEAKTVEGKPKEFVSSKTRDLAASATEAAAVETAAATRKEAALPMTPTAASTAAPTAKVSTPLESRRSFESLASTRVSDSSICSKRTKDDRRENFFRILTTKEFRLLSRRSKFGLTEEEEERGAGPGKLAFVEEGVARPLTWIYREGRLQTTENGTVLTFRGKDVVNENFQVVLESLNEKDPLQKWVVDEGGRIAPSTCPGLALASTGKNPKASRRHSIGIRVAATAATELKTRQDQTFNFQFVISPNEAIPSADEYPSRVKFVRVAAAIDDFLKPLSTTHWRRWLHTNPFQYEARGSKWRLRQDGNGVSFVDAMEEGVRESCYWLFGEDGRLSNVSTTDVLTLEMSFDTLGYQLKMKKPRVDDALQRWVLDADGRFTPEAHPDIRFTVENEEREEVRKVKKKRIVAGVVEKSDGHEELSFNFIIVLREKRNIPLVSALPSHVRFSHLSSLPRVRRIAHVIASTRRETCNNNALLPIEDGADNILGASNGVSEYLSHANGDEEPLMTPAEVEEFWRMIDARFPSLLERWEAEEPSTPRPQKKYLGDEISANRSTSPSAGLRGRKKSTSSAASRSPSSDHRDFLHRFEKMTTSHKLALQWRDTQEFLGVEDGEIVCRKDRNVVYSESYQWLHADGAIMNGLSGDALTLVGQDGVVVGPRRKDEGANQRWILTTSGLVVAKDDVGARVSIVRGGIEGEKAEVKLRRADGSDNGKKGEKEGFTFHVILEAEEALPDSRDYPAKLKFVAGDARESHRRTHRQHHHQQHQGRSEQKETTLHRGSRDEDSQPSVNDDLRTPLFEIVTSKASATEALDGPLQDAMEPPDKRNLQRGRDAREDAAVMEHVTKESQGSLRDFTAFTTLHRANHHGSMVKDSQLSVDDDLQTPIFEMVASKASATEALDGLLEDAMEPPDKRALRRGGDATEYAAVMGLVTEESQGSLREFTAFKISLKLSKAETATSILKAEGAEEMEEKDEGVVEVAVDFALSPTSMPILDATAPEWPQEGTAMIPSTRSEVVAPLRRRQWSDTTTTSDLKEAISNLEQADSREQVEKWIRAHMETEVEEREVAEQMGAKKDGEEKIEQTKCRTNAATMLEVTTATLENQLSAHRIPARRKSESVLIGKSTNEFESLPLLRWRDDSFVVGSLEEIERSDTESTLTNKSPQKVWITKPSVKDLPLDVEEAKFDSGTQAPTTTTAIPFASRNELLRLADTLISPSEEGDERTVTSITEDFSVTTQESEDESVEGVEDAAATAAAVAMRGRVTTLEEEEEAMLDVIDDIEGGFYFATLASESKCPQESADLLERPEGFAVPIKGSDVGKNMISGTRIERLTSSISEVESAEDLPKQEEAIFFADEASESKKQFAACLRWGNMPSELGGAVYADYAVALLYPEAKGGGVLRRAEMKVEEERERCRRTAARRIEECEALEPVEAVETPSAAQTAMMRPTLEHKTETKIEFLCERIEGGATELATSIGVGAEGLERRGYRFIKETIYESMASITPTMAEMMVEKTATPIGNCEKKTSPPLNTFGCCSVECPEIATMMESKSMKEVKPRTATTLRLTRTAELCGEMPPTRSSTIFEGASSELNRAGVGVIADFMLTTTANPIFERINQMMGDEDNRSQLTSRRAESTKEGSREVAVSEISVVEENQVTHSAEGTEEEKSSAGLQRRAIERESAGGKEQQAEVVLPEVSASLRKIEAGLTLLQCHMQESEAPESETTDELKLALPERFDVYTHRKFGLKIGWEAGEGVVKGTTEGGAGSDGRQLRCCVKNVEGASVVEEMVPLESGQIIIPIDKILPGASYSLVMSFDAEILSNRFLTFPPDPPTGVTISCVSAEGRPTSSSSSFVAPRRLRWRHPRGRHDKYRLTFRNDDGNNAGGASGDRAQPLASFDICGDVNSFLVGPELTNMLRRRSLEKVDRGAGDGGVDGGNGNNGKAKTKKWKGEMVMVEVRTIVFPAGQTSEARLHTICSDVETIRFRLSSTVNEAGYKKSNENSETWQWTPATMLGAAGILAGAAALYFSVAKEDVIRPPPKQVADARVIISGIRIPGKKLAP